MSAVTHTHTGTTSSQLNRHKLVNERWCERSGWFRLYYIILPRVRPDFQLIQQPDEPKILVSRVLNTRVHPLRGPLTVVIVLRCSDVAHRPLKPKCSCCFYFLFFLFIALTLIDFSEKSTGSPVSSNLISELNKFSYPVTIS